MILDTNSKNLISIFKTAGYKAFAVGGCVRDSMMDLPFSDIDIAVSCTPDITEEVLQKNGIRFYETGLKHGTVTALMDAKTYEITTFRTECGYADNRHPDKVTFVSNIEADLARRDFTVNAMAYNEVDGLVDVFGGLDDIKAKIIRAVGDANVRFNEDALRILRALRFSSTLDFTIEKNTSESIFKNKHLLKNIARERITEELKRLICGDGACKVLTDYHEVFNVILGQEYDEKKYYKASRKIVSLPTDSTLRIATLFKTLEPDFSKIKDSIVMSNDQLDRIRAIYAYDFKRRAISRKKVKRIMSEVGYSKACDIFLYHRNAQALHFAHQIENSNEPYTISRLAISGSDLIELGFSGKKIGDMLGKALDAVINEKIPNTKKNILDYIVKK